MDVGGVEWFGDARHVERSVGEQRLAGVPHDMMVSGLDGELETDRGFSSCAGTGETREGGIPHAEHVEHRRDTQVPGCRGVVPCLGEAEGEAIRRLDHNGWRYFGAGACVDVGVGGYVDEVDVLRCGVGG